MIHYGDQGGWKMAYILTGAIGFLWLIFWFWFLRLTEQKQTHLQSEYDYIHSDKDEVKPVLATKNRAKNLPPVSSRSAVASRAKLSGNDDHDQHPVFVHLFHHRQNCPGRDPQPAHTDFLCGGGAFALWTTAGASSKTLA